MLLPTGMFRILKGVIDTEKHLLKQWSICQLVNLAEAFQEEQKLGQQDLVL
jgi:hypothetical protein